MKKSHYLKVWAHCLRQLSQKLFALCQGSTIRGSTNQGITVPETWNFGYVNSFQIFISYGCGAMKILFKLAESCFIAISLIMNLNDLSEFKISSLLVLEAWSYKKLNQTCSSPDLLFMCKYTGLSYALNMPFMKKWSSDLKV